MRNKYLQGYVDGKNEILSNLKFLIKEEEQFIPDTGFDYLLTKISKLVFFEEKKLMEKIQNEK